MNLNLKLYNLYDIEYILNTSSYFTYRWAELGRSIPIDKNKFNFEVK